MRIIYEPRGRAAEYAPLAAGIYKYCGFGCRYCFNLGICGLYSEDFKAAAAPKKDALKKFEKDCAELAAAGETREILLSFSTDPYQPIDEELQLTRQAIEILIRYGLHFTVLTKAGFRAVRDFDLLAANKDLCRFGTSLTLAYPASSRIWEPNAAPVSNRIAAITQAHRMGIRTWVSMEPVIYPEQTLHLIMDTVDIVNCKPGIVDEYRIGKFNHINGPDAEQVIQQTGYQYPTDEEWRKFVQDAKEILDRCHCRYIFKKDLQPYLKAAGGA